MGSAMFDDGHFYGSFAASGEQDTNTGGVRQDSEHSDNYIMDIVNQLR